MKRTVTFKGLVINNCTHPCANHCRFCGIGNTEISNFPFSRLAGITNDFKPGRKKEPNDFPVGCVSPLRTGNCDLQTLNALRDLAKRLGLRGKGLKWAAQATVMIARDKELLDAAFEAGCRGFFIGFETFSSPNFKKLGKPDNWRQRFFEACAALHRKKIAIRGGFVFDAGGGRA